ncbi:hypothetical protein BaRGS_00030993 [Batillaria attramentaria]|uniref:Uncharacterized protein n=1 Tax=Batillaria attramentaria TaxID=370345 RepID=A0ABD0JT07_9CAEN
MAGVTKRCGSRSDSHEAESRDFVNLYRTILCLGIHLSIGIKRTTSKDLTMPWWRFNDGFLGHDTTNKAKSCDTAPPTRPLILTIPLR